MTSRFCSANISVPLDSPTMLAHVRLFPYSAPPLSSSLSWANTASRQCTDSHKGPWSDLSTYIQQTLYKICTEADFGAKDRYPVPSLSLLVGYKLKTRRAIMLATHCPESGGRAVDTFHTTSELPVKEKIETETLGQADTLEGPT